MQKLVVTPGVIALFGGSLMDAFVMRDDTGDFTEPNDLDVMCVDMQAACNIFDAMAKDFDNLQYGMDYKPSISRAHATAGHRRLIVTITIPRVNGSTDVISIDLCDATSTMLDRAS